MDYYVMRQGKFRNKTFAYIFDNHPDYCDYCLDLDVSTSYYISFTFYKFVAYIKRRRVLPNKS